MFFPSFVLFELLMSPFVLSQPRPSNEYGPTTFIYFVCEDRGSKDTFQLQPVSWELVMHQLVTDTKYKVPANEVSPVAGGRGETGCGSWVKTDRRELTYINATNH